MYKKLRGEKHTIKDTLKTLHIFKENKQQNFVTVQRTDGLTEQQTDKVSC